RLRANVMLSLRDDALAQLDVFKARLPGLFANYLRLDRLDRASATAAIRGPIERWNGLVPAEQRVEIEPVLVEAVLDEAAHAVGHEGRAQCRRPGRVRERAGGGRDLDAGRTRARADPSSPRRRRRDRRPVRDLPRRPGGGDRRLAAEAPARPRAGARAEAAA